MKNMYRYKLVPDDKVDRRSINGIVLDKNRWIYYNIKHSFGIQDNLVIEEIIISDKADGEIEYFNNVKKKKKKERRII